MLLCTSMGLLAILCRTSLRHDCKSRWCILILSWRSEIRRRCEELCIRGYCYTLILLRQWNCYLMWGLDDSSWSISLALRNLVWHFGSCSSLYRWFSYHRCKHRRRRKHRCRRHLLSWSFYFFNLRLLNRRGCFWSCNCCCRHGILDFWILSRSCARSLYDILGDFWGLHRIWNDWRCVILLLNGW